MGTVNVTGAWPSTLVKVGEYAFKDTDTGAGADLFSVTSIGRDAFYNAGLTGTLTLADGLTIIPTNAFRDNTGIVGVVSIPDSVTTIDAAAFAGTSIQEIHTSSESSLVSIDANAIPNTLRILELPPSLVEEFVKGTSGVLGDMTGKSIAWVTVRSRGDLTNEQKTSIKDKFPPNIQVEFVVLTKCVEGVCTTGFTTKPGFKHITCFGSECRVDECCLMTPSCNNADGQGALFDCGATHHFTGGNTACAGTQCLVTECCTENPTCDDIDGQGAAFSANNCGYGRTLKSDLSGICTDKECTADMCCDRHNSCNVKTIQLIGGELISPYDACDVYQITHTAYHVSYFTGEAKYFSQSTGACPNKECTGQLGGATSGGSSDCCGYVKYCDDVYGNSMPGFPKQSDDPYFFMDDDDFEAANATRPRETRFACPAGKRVVKGQRCDRTQNNFEVIGIDISARVYSYDEYDCTEQQCCQTATTCDGFTCGVFSTLKSGAENIACEGESCTAEECCNPNPVCPSAPEFSCPVGKQSINNPEMFSVLLQHAQRAIAVYMHTVIQDKKD